MQEHAIVDYSSSERRDLDTREKLPDTWEEKIGQESEYQMLVGEAADTEEVRDRWIDAVERLLELEGFERGETHIRRGFDEVRYDGDYGREIPKWVVMEDFQP